MSGSVASFYEKVAIYPLLVLVGILGLTGDLLMKAGTPPSLLLAQAAAVTDTSSQNCEDAKKAAAAGVFHGSQVSNGRSSDKCIAAVYDPSLVSVVETNPRGNPKNYRCVGKNVRLANSLSTGAMVTESWSAAANIVAGKCSVLYCSGTYCSEAKLEDGLSPSSGSYAEYPTPNSTGAFSPSEQQTAFAKALADIDQQKSMELSNRLDAAFNDISASQYKKDAEGIPDVTQPAYPELQKEFDKIDYNNYIMSQYEKTDVSPETRASQNYQDMISRSNTVQALSPDQYLQDWKGFDVQPLSEKPTQQSIAVQPIVSAESTFQSPGSFANGWRLSDNVEYQTWGSWAYANTKLAVDNALTWIATQAYNGWNGVFGK
jgi:hypothetical protein